MWGLALAGTILGAYGAYSSGQSAKSAAAAQARAQEEAARYARAAAAFEAKRSRRADARTLAEQRAQVAKAGVALEGSPLDVYAESVRTAEQNAQAILFEGELRARGLEAQARLSRLEGADAKRAGQIDTVTTILGGFGQMAKLGPSAGGGSSYQGTGYGYGTGGP